jgi:hypothetical protein
MRCQKGRELEKYRTRIPGVGSMHGSTNCRTYAKLQEPGSHEQRVCRHSSRAGTMLWSDFGGRTDLWSGGLRGGNFSGGGVASS